MARVYIGKWDKGINPEKIDSNQGGLVLPAFTVF